MFLYNIKSAIKSIINQKWYSAINILGLSIGIASALIIAIFVLDEISYDKFHKDSDDIYRIETSAIFGNNDYKSIYTPVGLSGSLTNDFSGIISATRLRKMKDAVVLTDNNKFIEKRIFSSDANFFSVFSFKLLAGLNELDNPNTVLITQEIAHKYFSRENPIGKNLEIIIEDQKYDLKITGISENTPVKSHFHYDFLISLSTFNFINDTKWVNGHVVTYIKLNKTANTQSLIANLDELTQNHIDKSFIKENKWNFYLKPLLKIHMYSSLNDEFENNGNIYLVYIFAGLSIFILIISCFNYINLSLGLSLSRMKEIGVKNILGASIANMRTQLLFESTMLCFISLLVSLAIIMAIKPYYHDFIHQDLNLNYFGAYYTIPSAIVFCIIIGIFSGSIPAFYLSNLNFVSIQKSNLLTKRNNSIVRNALVAFQFIISSFLLIGAIATNNQMRYINKESQKNLNFENLIVIKNINTLSNKESFKNELLKFSEIIQVSGSHILPGLNFNQWSCRPLESDNFNLALKFCCCDCNFKNTLGLKLSEGRFFENGRSTDSTSMIINQATLKYFGWNEPIGKQVYFRDKIYTIIGVIKDFHYESLYNKIAPMAMILPSDGKRSEKYITIKTTNDKAALVFIQKTWEKMNPSVPFEYSYLKNDYFSVYEKENKSLSIILVFTFLSIIIACIGLFGIISLSIQKKIKESAIRKVYGANTNDLFISLTKPYIKITLIAGVIGSALSYVILRKWLNQFEYHLNLSFWIFFIALTLLVILTLLTISYHVIKVTRQKPIESLKYE